MIESSPNILIIHSKKSELKRVEDFLKSIFETYQLPKKNFNKVLLCVSEAIVNSIVHGHKHNADKKIEVKVGLNMQDVSIMITDEGDGFDISAVPDPTDAQNLKKESGRGIHIMKSLCDVVEYNEKGNSIQFQIKCT